MIAMSPTAPNRSIQQSNNHCDPQQNDTKTTTSRRCRNPVLLSDLFNRLFGFFQTDTKPVPIEFHRFDFLASSEQRNDLIGEVGVFSLNLLSK